MKFLRFYKPAENADTLLVSPESVRVLQGSRTNRKISFKKKIGSCSYGSGKSKICKVDQQAGESGRANVAVQIQRPLTDRIHA